MTNNLAIGQTVERINSDPNYNGRIGQVLELNTETNRARVLWTRKTHSVTGEVYDMRKPLRTWVAFQYLAIHKV